MPPPSDISGKSASTVPESRELPRVLGFIDSTMINVGSMIGSGIFIVPALIALQLQSSMLAVGVWVVAGVVSLFGALSIAELGALMPRAGGQFVFLREVYGPLWGFLYGWSAFLVINTGSIAAVAVTFATYAGYFVPLSDAGIKGLAIGSVVALTVINCFGIKLGALVQNVFTFSKIGSLVALIVFGIILEGGTSTNFSPVLPALPFPSLIGPLGVALIAALWSYDGWIEITYVSGEVKNPERIIPRSLIASTILVILLYVGVSLTFHYVLSLPEMVSSQLVASDAAMKIAGRAGAVLVASAVIVATLGANNGFIFTCPRIYYAMAREGLFFRWLATVHPVYQTPVPSLIAQGVLASLLILSGTFSQLTLYVVFASWLFYAMSAGAVLVHRKRFPTVHRPYKTWGYPFTPWLFILFASYLVVSSIVESPIDSLFGLVIIVVGIPAYFYWKKKAS